MNKPIFMSSEHVRQMNDLLAASAEVRSACAKLQKDQVVAYQLTDEEGGAEVWWQMRVSPAAGLSLVLGQPAEPTDLTIRCGYWAMLEAAARGRDGSDAPPLAFTTVGDPGTLALLVDFFVLVRKAAKVDVVFPQRG